MDLPERLMRADIAAGRCHDWCGSTWAGTGELRLCPYHEAFLHGARALIVHLRAEKHRDDAAKQLRLIRS